MKRLALATGCAVVLLSSIMAVSAQGRSALSAQDRMFLDEAGHGAKYEIMAGHQAADRAATPEVVRFGQRMVADHGKEYDDLVRLGHDVGADIPDAPEHSQQRILDLFGQLSGGRLDCGYTPQEYSDHENDVARFTAEAEHGTNAQVRAFANRMLPTLRSHLDDAEKALDAIHSC
jgi:putative membrane protein